MEQETAKPRYTDKQMGKVLDAFGRSRSSMVTGTVAVPTLDNAGHHIYHRSIAGVWKFSHTVNLLRE